MERRGWSFFFSVIAVAAAGAWAQNPQRIQAPQSALAPPPQIERLGEGRFRIGRILLDKTSQTLQFPACVNMQDGMIELVACANGGKLHETIFRAPIEPYHLHLGLLLLGLNHKGGVKFQGDSTLPEGDQALVFVEKDGQRRRIEDYVWDRKRQAPMERTGWVFSGSKFLNGEYGAQLTRSLITTQHDPYTVLDNPLPTGVDSDQYEVNAKVTPPVGTSVTLIIQSTKPASPKQREGEGK